MTNPNGADHGLPDGWHLRQFRDVLNKVDRKIMLDDAEEYASVGVRWYGNGAFLRERNLGMNIARKQQWIIRAGDVVYNKLFAWKGSFAIAGEAVDGCIVSDKFPTYRIDESQIDPRFLAYYFQTDQPATQSAAMSKGGAAISKLTLNPPQFWDLTIPVPPLDEQRRIVARIQDLEKKIHEACDLRGENLKSMQSLLSSILVTSTGDLDLSGSIQDVLLGKPRNGWSAQCDNHPSGTAVLSLGAVTGFTYRPDQHKRTSLPVNPLAHYWLEQGDLLITRSNTPELVGHAAIYGGAPYPCIYPDLIMKIPVDGTKADVGFVHWWLQSAPVRKYIRSVAKGTSPTMRKISQGDVMNIPFPSGLPLVVQRDISARLNAIKDVLERVESDCRLTASSMEQLLPSILDMAFDGSL